MQGLELEEGLPVLNLTCVVAWDLPADYDVPTRWRWGRRGPVRHAPGDPRRAGWDVTLRYAFPAAGLDEKAMGTLLMLVVSSASSLRAETDRADRQRTSAERVQPAPGVGLSRPSRVATTCVPAFSPWPGKRQDRMRATNVATSRR